MKAPSFDFFHQGRHDRPGSGGDAARAHVNIDLSPEFSSLTNGHGKPGLLPYFFQVLDGKFRHQRLPLFLIFLEKAGDLRRGDLAVDIFSDRDDGCQSATSDAPDRIQAELSVGRRFPGFEA